MKIFHKFYYALGQKLRGENVYKVLTQLEESQWYSQDKLKLIQWQAIKRILSHAYVNIPFYRQTFDQARIKPDDIREWDDLHQIPILTKNEIRNNANLLKAVDKKYRCSKYSSSGSTGPSSIVLADRNTEAYRHAAVFRTRKWMGIDILDKMVMFWGVQLHRRGRFKDIFKDFFLNRKTISTHVLDENTFIYYHKIINRFKPKIIYGFTSAIYEFARLIKSKDLPMSSFPIKAVLVTGESLFSYQREMIEKVMKCKVFEQYGAEEFGPLAYECPEGNLHTMAENVFIEVENHDGVGKRGNLLITSLNNFAMPLIRYRIGDIGELSQSKCTCGRGLPLVGEITGRSVDCIRTPDGKIMHGINFDYLPKYFLNEIKQFQIVQNNINAVCVNIVKDDGFNDATLAEFETKLREVIGEKLKTDFKVLESIPKEKTGKSRFVVTTLSS